MAEPIGSPSHDTQTRTERCPDQVVDYRSDCMVCVGAVLVWNYNTPQLYTARTVLALAQGALSQRSYDPQMTLETLRCIATTNTVFEAASDTAREFGLGLSPDWIRERTRVELTRDTVALSVEVTCAEPRNAKVMTDIVAAEFRRVCDDLNVARTARTRQFLEQYITIAESDYLNAHDAVLMAKRGGGQADLVLLRIDATEAANTYGLLRQKLDEVQLREKSLRNEGMIRAVDAAYVFPVKQWNLLRLVGALLFGPLVGVLLALIVSRHQSRRHGRLSPGPAYEPAAPTPPPAGPTPAPEERGLGPR